MSDLITTARELCEGSVDPRIVRTVYELCEALESANKEIERLKEAQRWIPVTESLPESGKHVLLCCEIRPGNRKYVCDGYYAAAKTEKSYGNSGDIACEYDEEQDEYFLLEGWYEVIKNWDEFSSIAIDDFAVAWQPLPAPPANGGGK